MGPVVKDLGVERVGAVLLLLPAHDLEMELVERGPLCSCAHDAPCCSIGRL